ncbi:MAG: tandem-95 repeat protein [Methylovulum sp.]|nr:tandem-95 repeat protein [Methylovulum sp.]MCF7998882.1 tandem-95 repeat protein [Methylovulum sp.]
MATISKSVADYKAAKATLTAADVVTVSDTSANIQAVIGSLLSDLKVDSIDSTDGGEIKVSVAQLSISLGTTKLDKLAANDLITVTGTSSDLQKNLATLLASPKVDNIDSSQNSVQLALTADQYKELANMAKLNLGDMIVVSDATAKIQANLANLLADVKIDGIIAANSSLVSPLELTVAQTTPKNMAKLSATDKISVVDNSSINLNNKLAALLADSKIDSINSKDNITPIRLTATQAMNPAYVAKLSVDDTVIVTLADANGYRTGQITSLLSSGKIDQVVNTPTLVSAEVSVDEGQSVTLDVTHARANTQYAYYVSGTGIDSSDLKDNSNGVGNSLLNIFTTDEGGAATITLDVAADHKTEGTQTMSVRVLDLNLVSDVKINDTSLDNVAPAFAATTQAVSATEDTVAVVTVAATDVNSDTLTYTAGSAAHGTVTAGATSGTFNYTPNANYNGADSFVVTADDGLGGKTTQTVNLTIAPVNDAPTATATTLAAGTEDNDYIIKSSDILANATDIDGTDTLTVSGLTLLDASNGIITNNNDGTFTFKPSTNYNGQVDFNVTISDGTATVATTASLNLAAVNDGPVVTPIAAQNAEQGASFTLDTSVAFKDVENNTLTYTSTALPSGLTLNSSTGVISVIDPNIGVGVAAIGTKSVTVTATDNGTPNLSASTTFDIVTKNGVPVANADDNNAAVYVDPATHLVDPAKHVVLSGQSTQILVLKNDAYGDDPTTVTAVSQPGAGGLVEIASDGKSIYFTSTPGFGSATGAPVTFNYTITDSQGATSSNTVTLSVSTQLGGTTGPDYLIGSNGAETLSGGNGNDTINGGGGADVISGDAGNDTITFNGSENAITGGADNDTLVIPNTNSATLSGIDLSVSSLQAFKSAGGNTTTSVASFENLDASNSSLDLVIDKSGTWVASTPTTVGDLYGDNVNTTSIQTGSGNDKIDVGNHTAALTVAAGAGNDYILSSGTVATTVNAEAGDDTIVGGHAAITVDGGAGKDAITSGSAADSLVGGDGNDTISAGNGANTIFGGAGDDSINSGTGNDSIDGGDGNDTIISSTGTDTLSGGAGDDRIVMSGSLVGVVADGGTGINTLELDTSVPNAAALGTLTNFGTLKIDGSNTVVLASNVTPTTFDFSDTGTQALTLNTGYTNATSVVLTGDNAGNDDSVNNAANVALTVIANADDIDASTTITGGTATDTMQLTANNGTSDFTAVTKVDVVTVVDGGDATATAGKDITLTLGAYATALTVNASALDAALATATDTTAENLTLTSTGAGPLSVIGGAGNDTITSGSGSDTILGAAGNDLIDGGNGNNSIDGGDGNDTITSGIAIDTLKGGNGDDRFVMAGNLASTDTIDGGTGTNVLQVSSAIASATVMGGVSNISTLEVDGSIAVTLAANVAATTFDFSDSGAQVLTLNTGYTSATSVVLTGDNAGNDDLVNNAANVALTVIANADDIDATTTITGGTATDTMQLTANNGTSDFTLVTKVDVVTVVDGGDTTVAGGAGKDITLALGAYATALTVNASALDAAVVGAVDPTAENLTLTSTGAGALSVIGGAGDDTITAGSGNDTILSSAGNDTISTGNGANSVDGGDGNDTITAGTGLDTLNGGAGDDKFIMGANLNGDVIDGGAGSNTVQIAGNITTAAALSSLSNIGIVEVVGGFGVTLAANVTPTTFNFSDSGDQTLTLSAGYTNATSVVLTGDSTANADSVINSANVTLTVTANAGDIDTATTITGGTGVDTLVLTADNDASTFTNVTKVEVITVVDGGDATVAGGAGKDITLALGAYATPLTVNASALDAAVAGAVDATAENLTLTSAGAGALSVIGGAGDDAITAGSGNDTILSSAGNDTISTGSGANSVDGGDGNDTITGGTGNDTILGGLGNDNINGSAGLDLLTGGAGTDTFGVVTNANGNIFSTITDAVAGDKISFVDLGTETFTAAKLSLGATAVYQDYLNFAAAGNGSAHANISWFQFGGNTYAVEDMSAGSSFVNGTDLVVSLTGLVDLSTATGTGTNVLTLV